MKWTKLNRQEIKQRVFQALDENRNYDSDNILGIPGSYLDTVQFYRDAEFLKDAPFLRTFINNPNHIGCHTLTEDKGEDIFKGTQKLEIELIRLISEEIFHAAEKSVDGYIAPGGTEANIQALWIYRNYYTEEFQAGHNEVGVIFSSDSHYSFYKGCNLLDLIALPVQVNEENRQIDLKELRATLQNAKENGVKYLIVIANMSTTMFGSVDKIFQNLEVVREFNLPYKVHVDGAFGGFIYPFTNPESCLNFGNEEICSITLDAHKMLMAPYGTGIFLIRKGWMSYTTTSEAQYVQGLDYTICGSRNGAHAVAIWMILHTHGPQGWLANISSLMSEADRLCYTLQSLGIKFFREPFMNIICIKAKHIDAKLAAKFRLVADNFDSPKWWKIVVMPHTKGEIIDRFLADLHNMDPTG